MEYRDDAVLLLAGFPAVVLHKGVYLQKIGRESPCLQTGDEKPAGSLAESAAPHFRFLLLHKEDLW
jgi:hypothetical protein